MFNILLCFLQILHSRFPQLQFKVQSAVDPRNVRRRLELRAGVALAALAQRLQLQGVLGRLAQTRHQVETLPLLRVGLLAELHREAPSAFRHHQRNVQVSLVLQHALRDVLALEVTLLALGDLEDFAEASDPARAVASVTLVIAVAETMLLLGILNKFKY